jgi:hypothetical protein
MTSTARIKALATSPPRWARSTNKSSRNPTLAPRKGDGMTQNVPDLQADQKTTRCLLPKHLSTYSKKHTLRHGLADMVLKALTIMININHFLFTANLL